MILVASNEQEVFWLLRCDEDVSKKAGLRPDRAELLPDAIQQDINYIFNPSTNTGYRIKRYSDVSGSRYYQ